MYVFAENAIAPLRRFGESIGDVAWIVRRATMPSGRPTPLRAARFDVPRFGLGAGRQQNGEHWPTYLSRDHFRLRRVAAYHPSDGMAGEVFHHLNVRLNR